MIGISPITKVLAVLCALLLVATLGLLWGLNNRMEKVAELTAQEQVLRNAIKREQQTREEISRNEHLKERLYAEQNDALARAKVELAQLRKRVRTSIASTPESRDWGDTVHPPLINCLLSRAYRSGAPCPPGTSDAVPDANGTSR